MDISFIFSLAVLVVSIVIHEVSHGYMAYFLGDSTAKYAGRLTLNPIKHIDLFGSIIVPFLTSLFPGGIIFGWAKPVPFNPYNLRSKKWGEALVAIAGPASNIFLALIFGLVIRYLSAVGSISPATLEILVVIVLVNITLAIFNLVPVPPLDGSKIFYSLLPYKWTHIRTSIEKHSFLYVIIFLLVIWQFLEPLIPWLFRLITGLSF